MRLKGEILRRIVPVVIVFPIAMFALLGIIPAVSPTIGAQVADVIRSVVGPQPVADIESVSFWIQDQINQYQAAADGGKLGISLDQQTAQISAQYQPAQQKSSQQTSQVVALRLPPVHARTILAPSTDAVTASPQIGWQAYGPEVHGQPVMAQALLTLDPQRSYAGIALVRIDLSKLQLNMEPGFLEPSHSAAVQNAIPNLGSMPTADQARLIAAFNGGFKAVNGQYGMMVNNVTLLPPIPGIATVAIYKDGHIQIGIWGQDINPSPDIVAYRQNCPPIIQNGQLGPQVNTSDRAIWGETIGNLEITWRTGLGITQDGRYLIYAVGNGTSVATLAQALQDAGAYNAMQLDINRHYAHFATYETTPSGTLTPVQLLKQMESDPTLYLTAHSRDFFYLTTR